MSTYGELQERALKLLEQAEQQRLTEVKVALEEISRTMHELAIGLDELLVFLCSAGFRMKSAKKKFAASLRVSGAVGAQARYVNTATGETWSGRGRPPRWIVESEAKGVYRQAYEVHRGLPGESIR